MPTKRRRPPVPYPGQPHRGEQSLRAEAIGRALCRAGRRAKRKKYAINVYVFARYPKRTRRGWGTRKISWLKSFQRHHGLTSDGEYGPKTHKLLAPYFYTYERSLLHKYEMAHKPSPAEKHFKDMFHAMQAVSRQTPGYNYGGEHDGSIADDLPSASFDCSSSSSYALYKGHMFPFKTTLTSGELAVHWGEPGKGKYFTVWANSGHAWIQLTAPRRLRGSYWRFDTSPYGDWRSSRSGARLRFLPRPTWGFTPRHWPGMAISTSVVVMILAQFV